MELKDIIFLAAAIIYATSEHKQMDNSVKKAKALWLKVLRQDRED